MKSQSCNYLRCRHTVAISAATLLRVVVVWGSLIVGRWSLDGSTRLPEDDHAAQVKEIRPAVVQTKALGIQWDVTGDEFFYVSKNSDYEGEVIKRRMLSQLSSMYDPLGLLAPLIHRGKILFQEITKMKTPWDEPIPPDLARRWLDWIRSPDVLADLR